MENRGLILEEIFRDWFSHRLKFPKHIETFRCSSQISTNSINFRKLTNCITSTKRPNETNFDTLDESRRTEWFWKINEPCCTCETRRVSMLSMSLDEHDGFRESTNSPRCKNEAVRDSRQTATYLEATSWFSCADRGPSIRQAETRGETV